MDMPNLQAFILGALIVGCPCSYIIGRYSAQIEDGEWRGAAAMCTDINLKQQKTLSAILNPSINPVMKQAKKPVKKPLRRKRGH